MRGMAPLLSALAVVAVMTSVFLLLDAGEVEAATEWNEGTVLVDPSPGDELTGAGYPIKDLKPGENTTFNLIVSNSHNTAQTIYITIEGPEGWSLSMPGIVDVGSSGEEIVPLTVEVPDGFPDESMDPTIGHPIRIEAVGNLTGDHAFIDCIVDLNAEISHDMNILPDNVKQKTRIVHRGNQEYFDLMIENDGEMNDNYVLSIQDHQTNWYLQFREGGNELLVPVKHGSAYYTQVLVGVDQEAVHGSSFTFVITTTSEASSLFSTGKRTDQVSVTFQVVEASTISIMPIHPYYEIVSGDDLSVAFELVHSGVEKSSMDPEVAVYQGNIPQTDWTVDTEGLDYIEMDISERRMVEVFIRSPTDISGLFSIRMSGSSGNAAVNPGEIILNVNPTLNVTIDSISGGPFKRGSTMEITAMVTNNGQEKIQSYIVLDRLPCYCGAEVDVNPISINGRSTTNVLIRLEPDDEGELLPFTVEVIAMIPSVDGTVWIEASTRTHDIEFIQMPNLNITYMEVPDRPVEEGLNVTVNVTIENNGDLPISGATVTLFEVSYKLSHKEVVSSSISLGVGESVTISLPWTAHMYVVTLKAVVDTPVGIEDEVESDNEISRSVYVNKVKDDLDPSGDGGEGSIPAEVAFAAVAGSVFLAGGLSVIVSSDAFRYSFFSMIVPLYSKLRPDHLLSNKLRRRIYVYVQNHPGEHFRSILVNLNLTNGTLAHHLYTLEKENLIRSQRDGLYRRFYPAGYRIDEERLNISPIQRKILDLIKERPGLSQKDISKELDISSSTVNYNIKALREKDLIEIVKDGKMTRIFPPKDKNS